MLLVGGPGSGKTHLAEVWRGLVPGVAVAAADLAVGDVPGLAAAGAVVVEDAERLRDEAALFHLWNLMAAAGGHLMVTARGVPRDWGLTLPDLASRMAAMPVARLEPPCDALLSAVLVKQFGDRQVAVSPAVVARLVQRMERSLSAVRAVVARLDRLALERRQAVDARLVREVLAGSGAGAEFVAARGRDALDSD